MPVKIMAVVLVMLVGLLGIAPACGGGASPTPENTPTPIPPTPTPTSPPPTPTPIPTPTSTSTSTSTSTPVPLANLSITEVLSGWPSSLVVSESSNLALPQESEITEGSTFYLSWVVWNTGTADAGAPNFLDLYLDGKLVETFPLPRLKAGEFSQTLYYPMQDLPVGAYQLKLVVNAVGTVREADITDNELVRALEVSPRLKLASLEVDSAMPGQTLVLPGGGFQADTPASVEFFNEAFSITVPSIEVTAQAVSALVPPYLDLKSGQSAEGQVNIRISQEQDGEKFTSSTLSGFVIRDLLQSTVTPGSVLLAYLQGTKEVILDAQAELGAISAVSEGAVSDPQLQTQLAALLNHLTTLEVRVMELLGDSSATLDIGSIGAATVELSAKDLVLLDRLIGARFISLYEEFPLESESARNSSPSIGGVLLRPSAADPSINEKVKEDIKRYKELVELYRQAAKQPGEEGKKLATQLMGFGSITVGLLGMAGILTPPGALLAGSAILFGGISMGAQVGLKADLNAVSIPGGTATEIDAYNDWANFQQKAYMDALPNLFLDVVSAVGGVGEAAGLLKDIVTIGKETFDQGKTLLEKAKESPVEEIERSRTVFVLAVPSSPVEGQAYWVDVRINPPAQGFFATATVHGTDGYSTSGSASTDGGGFARVLAVEGAESGVVDTITVVVRIAAGGKVVGHGSASVRFQ